MDELVAAALTENPFETREMGDRRAAVIIALMKSALARASSLDDIADGSLFAAADLDNVRGRSMPTPIGHNRTIRNRARFQARSVAMMAVGSLSEAAIELDLMAVHANGAPSFSDDPDVALAELYGAWSRGENELLPLLLSEAAAAVPNPSAGGNSRRLRLLEIGSNVFRDSESLVAVGWTSRWVREATGDDVGSVRALANGLKTRAHVLQLHGYLRAASRDLAEANRTFGRLSKEDVADYDVVLADLAIRHSALILLSGDVKGAEAKLAALQEHQLSGRMLISAARHDLHAESLRIANTLKRRSGRRMKSMRYENALERLIGLSSSIPGDLPLAVVDTIIASASRVGDVQTIRDALGLIKWPPRASAPNILHRLDLRIKEAAHLPGLGDLSELVVPVVADPFRIAGLIPTRLEYML